jgi:hypothetical protein
MTDLDKIQKDGANMRAICGRLTLLQNPFYRLHNMPGNTGEPFEKWIKKAEAWEFGWRMEDAMRPSAEDELIRALHSAGINTRDVQT